MHNNTVDHKQVICNMFTSIQYLRMSIEYGIELTVLSILDTVHTVPTCLHSLQIIILKWACV